MKIPLPGGTLRIGRYKPALDLKDQEDLRDRALEVYNRLPDFIADLNYGTQWMEQETKQMTQALRKKLEFTSELPEEERKRIAEKGINVQERFGAAADTMLKILQHSIKHFEESLKHNEEGLAVCHRVLDRLNEKGDEQVS